MEADFDIAGAAPPPPKTDSFLAADPPEKLKAPGAGPGSVADLPNEKRLVGCSLALVAAVLLLLKVKAAVDPAVVVAAVAPPPKLKEGAGAPNDAALVT